LLIVAFTANVLREQHAECIAAGMDAVATKPLQRADVEALLRRAHVDAEQLSARRGSSSRPAKRRSGTLLALV
jgi:CheY-like chemotaxis protein